MVGIGDNNATLWTIHLVNAMSDAIHNHLAVQIHFGNNGMRVWKMMREIYFKVCQT